MSVVYKKDGKYLRYTERTTHTGTHRDAEWVDDLQQATVFHTFPPHQVWRTELKGAEPLDATETRIVTLTSDNEAIPDLDNDGDSTDAQHSVSPSHEN